MTDQLGKQELRELAQRRIELAYDVDGPSHYEGCESVHIGCLLARLLDELEAYKADARRYRWLQREHGGMPLGNPRDEDGFYANWRKWGLTAAIDSAIADEGKA